MHSDQGMNINEICLTLKISRATFYRYISLIETLSVRFCSIATQTPSKSTHAAILQPH